MRRVLISILFVITLASVFAVVASPSKTAAQPVLIHDVQVTNSQIINIGFASSFTDPLPKTTTDKITIEKVIKFVLALVGALCVLMITISGFKYVMSMGDPTATKKAKDTILYALIGLVVVIFANVIVGFVLTNI